MARPYPFCDCRTECTGEPDCYDSALTAAPLTDVEVYVPAGIFDAGLCDPTGADDMVAVSSTLGTGWQLRRYGIINDTVADYTYNVLDNACDQNPIESMLVNGGEAEYLGETQTTFGFTLTIGCDYSFITQTSTCILRLYAEWRDHALIRRKSTGGSWGAPFWQRAGYHLFNAKKALIQPLAVGMAVTVTALPDVVADGYSYRDDRQFNSNFPRPGRPLYDLRTDAPRTWTIQF